MLQRVTGQTGRRADPELALDVLAMGFGNRGYDADCFREALKDNGIRAYIPSRKQFKTAVRHDTRGYKQRNRIGIMFGRLKDRRRVATWYDRCPMVALSAIALAVTVIYWV